MIFPFVFVTKNKIDHTNSNIAPIKITCISKINKLKSFEFADKSF